MVWHGHRCGARSVAVTGRITRSDKGRPTTRRRCCAVQRPCAYPKTEAPNVFSACRETTDILRLRRSPPQATALRGHRFHNFFLCDFAALREIFFFASHRFYACGVCRLRRRHYGGYSSSSDRMSSVSSGGSSATISSALSLSGVASRAK